MRRLFSFSLLAVFGLVAPPVATAQQSFTVSLGGFTPRPLDARGNEDVIYRNNAFLSTLNRDAGIDINQFNGFTMSAEYLVAIGRSLEAGLGLGFYQRTVTTVDTDNVNSNGREIFQDDKLRVVPFSATIRLMPLGNDAPVQPYIGGGVGVFKWRYSETGEFVDTARLIFAGNFVGSGSEVGPVVLGGVKFPIGPALLGGEIRWQSARANLPTNQGFAGNIPNPKIDLGGVNYLFTIGMKF